MSCRRENICARLLEILNTINDVEEVARNLDEFPDVARPMIILIDGEEEVAPEFQRPWVKNKAWTIVDMIPIIVVSMGGKPEDIGPNINELMARVITAVMTDDELQEIITTNGSVVYLATDNRLNHSLAMDCDLQIRFKIRYPLLPSVP